MPQKWSTFGFLMLEIWCCHYWTLNATANDFLMVFGLCTTFSGLKVLAWASNSWQKLGWQLFDPSKFCVGTEVHSSKHDLTKRYVPWKRAFRWYRDKNEKNLTNAQLHLSSDANTSHSPQKWLNSNINILYSTTTKKPHTSTSIRETIQSLVSY